MEWLEPNRWEKRRFYFLGREGDVSLVSFTRCGSIAEAALALKWGEPLEFSNQEVLDSGDFGRRLIKIVEGRDNYRILPRSEGFRDKLQELLSNVRFDQYRERFTYFLRRGVANLEEGFANLNMLKQEESIHGVSIFHVYGVLDIEKGILSGITDKVAGIRGIDIGEKQVRVLLEVSNWSKSGQRDWTVIGYAPERQFDFDTEEARRIFETSVALFNLGKGEKDFSPVSQGRQPTPNQEERLVVPPPPNTPQPARPPAWANR